MRVYLSMSEKLTIIIPTINQHNYPKIIKKLEILSYIKFQGKVVLSINADIKPIKISEDIQGSLNLIEFYHKIQLPIFDHFKFCIDSCTTEYVMLSADDDYILESISNVFSILKQKHSIIFFPIDCKYASQTYTKVDYSWLCQNNSNSMLKHFSDLHFYAIYNRRVFKKLLTLILFDWKFCSKEHQSRRKAFLFGLAAYTLKRKRFFENNDVVMSFNLNYGGGRRLKNISSISVDLQLLCSMYLLLKKRKVNFSKLHFLKFVLNRLRRGFLI